jgi:hypothetical protein
MAVGSLIPNRWVRASGTELIYRKQIRPVLQYGTEAMDRIFSLALTRLTTMRRALS